MGLGQTPPPQFGNFSHIIPFFLSDNDPKLVLMRDNYLALKLFYDVDYVSSLPQMYNCNPSSATLDWVYEARLMW